MLNFIHINIPAIKRMESKWKRQLATPHIPTPAPTPTRCRGRSTQVSNPPTQSSSWILKQFHLRAYPPLVNLELPFSRRSNSRPEWGPKWFMLFLFTESSSTALLCNRIYFLDYSLFLHLFLNYWSYLSLGMIRLTSSTAYDLFIL